MSLRAGLAIALALVLAIAASSVLLRLSQAGVGCAPWPACQVERASAPVTLAGVDAARVDATRADAPAWAAHVRALHRVSASLAGALFVLLVVLGWSHWRSSDRAAGVLLLALAAGLALLGRYTPSTLPAVALANLLGGHALLACTAWLIAAAPRPTWPPPSASHGSGGASFAVLLALVAAQAALGAMVGVRAAGGACLDGCAWPTWMPPDPRVLDPFVPTAALDASPASAARRWLLLAHTLVAVVLVAAVSAVAWAQRRRARRAAALPALTVLAVLVAAATGVAMSLRPLPLGAATAHSLAAAATLALVAGWWRLRRAAAGA